LSLNEIVSVTGTYPDIIYTFYNIQNKTHEIINALDHS